MLSSRVGGCTADSNLWRGLKLCACESVMPSLPISEGVALPLEEIELRVSRSSGPGGQHANVTASRVEAIFDVNASQALSPEQKARIGGRLGLARDRRRAGHALPAPQPRAGARPACATARRGAEGVAPAHQDAADAGVAEAADRGQEAAQRDQARAAAARPRLERGRLVAAERVLDLRGGGERDLVAPGWATSWTPIGRPSGELPARTVAAGQPVRE